jgi:hypothetical protein
LALLLSVSFLLVFALLFPQHSLTLFIPLLLFFWWFFFFFCRLKSGEPNAFIGLLQYALLEFSRHVAQFISEMGYELLGKSDSKFMENVYKFARNHFNYRPTLNLAQFFSTGFAERYCTTKNHPHNPSKQKKKFNQVFLFSKKDDSGGRYYWFREDQT